ncbi:hypothetical protein GCM10009747_17110 [Agromyces humatus]|uniref:Uncharacterized protein n=1 Tax=Agromyces humatus TaxID=279573 RepID=A0ABN2KKQ0_9MICO
MDANRQLVEKQRHLEMDVARYKAELDQEARREEQEVSARTELDRIREPLLAAALDLGDRIDNIRNRGFLFYLSGADASRQKIARSGTMYRLARYWCIVETIYDNIGMGRFKADDTTRPVAATLRAVGSAFASDLYDDRRLMVWREEQRAIAEKMRAGDASAGPIGYATFAEHYDSTFSTWFAAFERDLDSASSSERLRVVQHELAELARHLDPAGNFQEQWEKLLRGATNSR